MIAGVFGGKSSAVSYKKRSKLFKFMRSSYLFVKQIFQQALTGCMHALWLYEDYIPENV